MDMHPTLRRKWERAKEKYDRMMWRNRVEGAKENHNNMNDEDKRLAWKTANKIAYRKKRTRMELTPEEEEEFICQWENKVLNKNDAFDTDEDFTRTLDRMYAHIPKCVEMDREYAVTMEDME